MPRGVYKHKHTPPNKINWTPAMEQFLKDNYKTLTNRQLAKVLGLRLTITRTKLYEMGLKRMELEYWTEDQIALLKQAYTLVGDIEITHYFNALFKKKKGWTNKHIRKKRLYLELHRTPEQVKSIMQRNVDLGCGIVSNLKRWDGRVSKNGSVKFWNIGGRFPVPYIKTETGWRNLLRYNWEQVHGPIPDKFCVSRIDESKADFSINNLRCTSWKEKFSEINRTDIYVASKLAGNDRELRDFIIKNNPELIEIERLQLQLRWELKNAAAK